MSLLSNRPYFWGFGEETRRGPRLQLLVFFKWCRVVRKKPVKVENPDFNNHLFFGTHEVLFVVLHYFESGYREYHKRSDGRKN